jgi:hypothetical protein
MKDCLEYKIKYYDFIYPSIDTFDIVCQSYDKTNLFIVSLVRTIFYFLTMYNFCSKNINKNIKYFLVGWVIINIIILVYILSKNQKYEKIKRDSKITLSESNEPEIIYYVPVGWNTPIF